MSSKINIAQLEEYLKQAGLENGKLEEVLSPIKELNNQRRYGLVWEEPDNTTYGSDSAEQELLRNFPFLKEINEHRISNGEDNPDHLLIEGDNLHALKTMQYTHKDKIDVIYIDPPYNTGNTDFVYNDKYVDNEDSWRHSKWLSFMNKRLRLARELMTDEGVIFISIDDNEYAQLKLLCDQVFGERNFINNVVVKTKESAGVSGRSSNSGFRKGKEYMLVYSKEKRNLELNKLYENELISDLVGRYKEEGKGYYYTRVMTEEGDKEFVKEVDGLKIYKHAGHEFKTVNQLIEEDNISLQEVYNKYYDKIFMVTNAQSSVYKKVVDNIEGKQELYSYEYIPIKGKDANKITVKHIWNNTLVVWLRDTIHLDKGNVYNRKEKNDLWLDISYGRLDLEGGVDFKNGKKPLNLLQQTIAMHPNKNATVLDFFAGSGTTAHAVMELNKEDGGNRQAIVITNNEINDAEEERLLVEKGHVEPFTGSRRGTKKYSEWLKKVNEFKQTPEYLEFIQTDEYKDLGIARAVTEQRINKVINGYTTPRGKEVEGLSNNNFYHFEVVLEPDLLDDDLNTYVLINKTKDIIKIKEDVFTEEVDISTDNTPAIKLVNDEKEVIVVQTVRVFEEDIHEIVQNFNEEDKQHIIYTSYSDFDYNIHNITYKELPKELLQAIKHNEG